MNVKTCGALSGFRRRLLALATLWLATLAMPIVAIGQEHYHDLQHISKWGEGTFGSGTFGRALAANLNAHGGRDVVMKRDDRLMVFREPDVMDLAVDMPA